MHVVLREITRDNWEQVIRLRVPEVQRKFIPTNVYALAESKFLAERLPLAIYDGQTLIGMTVCSYNPDLGRAWIHRLVVAEEYLNQGYTRAAMRKIIRRMRKLPGCTVIGVDYRPDNAMMARFYESFGFLRTGQVTASGDVVACLRVAPDPLAGRGRQAASSMAGGGTRATGGNQANGAGDSALGADAGDTHAPVPAGHDI